MQRLRKPSSLQGFVTSQGFFTLYIVPQTPLRASLKPVRDKVYEQINQSIIYNPDGSEDSPHNSSRVGCSPIGIVLGFSLACIMLMALMVIASINQYSDRDNAMPLMSICSAAISTGCHPPEDDTDTHFLPVRWGYYQL